MVNCQKFSQDPLLSNVLDLPLQTLYHLPTCQEQYQAFESILKTLVNMYFPLKAVKRCSNDRPWITDPFRELIKKRQHALMRKNHTSCWWYCNKVNTARKFFRRIITGVKLTRVLLISTSQVHRRLSAIKTSKAMVRCGTVTILDIEGTCWLSDPTSVIRSHMNMGTYMFL